MNIKIFSWRNICFPEGENKIYLSINCVFLTNENTNFFHFYSKEKKNVLLKSFLF